MKTRESTGVMHLPTYTFVADDNGATELQQIETGDLGEAVRLWNVRTGIPRVDPARLELDSPVPVSGLKRVWCFSGLDEDENLYLVHVIQTAES